jgi:(p)ppGpp synthase/HD superfamily hydrolase
MKEWLQVLKAADAAARWHVHQRRKGPAVIAALLHDAIEDCEVPKELIVETFGKDAANIVAEVTDDKSLPKAVRKEEQVKNAAKKSPRAKILKLADKTSNLRSLATSPPADWSVRRKVEYIAGPEP